MSVEELRATATTWRRWKRVGRRVLLKRGFARWHVYSMSWWVCANACDWRDPERSV